MTVGLETYDASGNPLLSITDRISMILGSSTTGATDGSISHAGLANGDPFICPLNPGVVSLGLPSWTISGTTISWAYPNPTSPGNQNVAFYFGIY